MIKTFKRRIHTFKYFKVFNKFKMKIENKKLIIGVDEDLWKRFTALAKLKGMKIGQLFNETIFVLLEKEKIVSKKQNNKGDEK